MKFKIGKREFNIEFKDKINKDDDYGYIHFMDSVIKIKNTNEMEKRVTLLHEMFHAIFRSIGHDNCQSDVMVHGLAERWYEVLRDNPEIIQYLMDTSI